MCVFLLSFLTFNFYFDILPYIFVHIFLLFVVVIITFTYSNFKLYILAYLRDFLSLLCICLSWSDFLLPISCCFFFIYRKNNIYEHFSTAVFFSFIFCLSEKFLSLFLFYVIILWTEAADFHSLLTCTVSIEKSADSLISCLATDCHLLCCQDPLFIFNFSPSHYDVFWSGSVWIPFV